MGIVLYDNPASSNAMKVRFLLAELGPRLRAHATSRSPGRGPTGTCARYPFGTIPFLDDDGYELGESNAILRYLANREGRTDLYPSEPAARAAVDWALDAWSTQFRGTFFPAELIGLMHGDWERGGEPARGCRPGRARRGDRGGAPEARHHGALRRRQTARWSARFTIADIAFAPVLWRWYRMPLDFAPWPKVALLRDTVTARPAFTAMGPAA